MELKCQISWNQQKSAQLPSLSFPKSGLKISLGIRRLIGCLYFVIINPIKLSYIIECHEFGMHSRTLFLYLDYTSVSII